MNHLDRMMDAMTHSGNRVVHAWLMAVASYTYTRAHDGMIANEHGERYSFGRWYAFKWAVACGWRYLWIAR